MESTDECVQPVNLQAEIKVQVTIAPARCRVGFAMGMDTVRVPLFQLVNGVRVKRSQITFKFNFLERQAFV